MAEAVATVVDRVATAANNHGVATRADMETRVATKPDHRVATDSSKAMETSRATAVLKEVTRAVILDSRTSASLPEAALTSHAQYLLATSETWTTAVLKNACSRWVLTP